MFSKFLDPKNDIAFKRIFETEKNKDILIHFLNDMITFKEKRPIREISFLKTIQDPETAVHKMSIVDVLCKDEIGNQYIVEMQVTKEKGFEKRAQYYASKAYISQVHVGGEYQDLKEVIFLAISDVTLFPEKKGFKSDHVILDRESYEHDLKDFSFTFLELSKFHKGIDELTSIVDKWMYFFAHAETTSENDLQQIIGDDLIIEKAYQELSRFGWNEIELRTYDQRIKYEWAYRASMEQKFDDGIEKGIQIGREEGLQQGREEGVAAIINSMLSSGVEIEAVAAMTKLSIDDVQRLAKAFTCVSTDIN